MRESGILMHITSLPSDYGYGTLGAQAFKFADFLYASGIKVWQLLPVNPTGYGNSPYQSTSVFAGNPYLIDIDALVTQGLIKKGDIPHSACGKVDYAMLFSTRLPLLKKAYHAAGCPRYEETVCQKSWLWDYALFMAIKTYYDFASLKDWQNGVKFRDGKALAALMPFIESDAWFNVFVQKLFFDQWKEFKYYVNSLGIKLMGDMGIYAAYDSADVWSNPELFKLDAQLNPTAVAGVPPDYFSPTGQLWGNPLYDWAYHRLTGFNWWIERMKSMLELFDVVRIDHFRGFESYYSIPASASDASCGSWEKGPGKKLFEALSSRLGRLPIIAEDLGVITQQVKTLLDELGYPGMRVLQFAFTGDSTNPHLPHNHTENAVVYTGTHDNDTLAGFVKSLSAEQYAQISEYTGMPPYEGLMRAALGSVCRLCILPMQDILKLDSTARMNIPATDSGNWSWQLGFGQLTPEVSAGLMKLNKLFGRA